MTTIKSEPNAPERIWISPSAFLARSASAVIYDEANREPTDVEYVRVSPTAEVSKLAREAAEKIDNAGLLHTSHSSRAQDVAALEFIISSVFARSQKRAINADRDASHSKIVIPKYKMLETAPKGYYSLGRVHPETVVRWFLDLVQETLGDDKPLQLDPLRSAVDLQLRNPQVGDTRHRLAWSG